MALMLGFTDNRGFTSPNAYFRVVQVEIDYFKNRAQVQVFIYKDDLARRDNKQPMGGLTFSLMDSASVTEFSDIFGSTVLEQTGNNPMKATYTWLKTQPELEGAVDV